MNTFREKLRIAIRDKETSKYRRHFINDILYRMGSTLAFEPYLIFIFLNSWCNAKCIMCDIGQKNRNSSFYQLLNRGGDFDIPLLRELVDQLRSFKPIISFASTEPLLYPHLIEAVKIAKGAGLECHIVSNGYLLPKYSDALCDTGIDSIILSVDGLRETHDMIRGLPGCFNKIVSGIRTILAKPNRPRIRINTVISPINEKEIYSTAAFFHKLRVDSHSFSHINFVTSSMMNLHNQSWAEIYPATESAISALNPAETDIAVLYDQIAKVRRSFPRVTFSPPIFEKAQLEAYYRSDHFIGGSGKCKVAWQTSTITADGDVVPFTRCYNISFGNIRRQPFLEIWNGAKMRRFREHLLKFRAFPACARCCAAYQ